LQNGDRRRAQLEAEDVGEDGRPRPSAPSETRNTIEARSSSERGFSADRIPSGIAITSQRKAAPRTRDAVTRESWPTIQRTEVPSWYE
jgi:hypothetical protein